LKERNVKEVKHADLSAVFGGALNASECKADIFAGAGIGATVGGSIGLAGGPAGGALGALVGLLGGGAVGASNSSACGGFGGMTDSTSDRGAAGDGVVPGDAQAGC
jgi:hypothetical protein